MPEIRVAIADDHPVFLAGERALPQAAPEIILVSEAITGTAALALIKEANPDTAVIDLSLPGIGGLELTRLLREACPAVRVLALTLHEDWAYVQPLLQTGARGYLLKRSAAEDLVHAIRTVAEGGVYPGVAKWQRRQADRTKMDRKVSTVGGRVYRFAWEPKREYVRNLALNLPVQGTAAEIAIEALIRVDARLQSELKGRAHLVLQVHDEFVVEMDDNEPSLTRARILEEEMTAAFRALLPGAPTTRLVDAHTGQS